MDIEKLILSSSYFGIFTLMIINGICGMPSSQLIYIIAGYFAFLGNINWIWVVFLGGLGHAIGNLILYEVARQKGLKYILKFKIFPKKEILKIDAVMKKKGWWFLIVGKFVNPIKIIIPIPCGMAKMNRAIFSLIIFTTSFLWAGIFVAIGYFFGKTWTFAYYYGVIMFILAIVVMGIFYKYMNSAEIIKEVNNSKL